MGERQQIVSNVLYITNIPKKIIKKELENLLIPYGKLLSLNIIYKPEYAFAFAQFDDMRDAVQCVRDLNQQQYSNRKIKVQFKMKKANDKNTIPKTSSDNGSQKTEKNTKKEEENKTQTSLKLIKQQTLESNVHAHGISDEIFRNRYHRQRSYSREHSADSESRSRSRSRQKRQDPYRYSRYFQPSKYFKQKREQDSQWIKISRKQLYQLQNNITAIYEHIQVLCDSFDHGRNWRSRPMYTRH